MKLDFYRLAMLGLAVFAVLLFAGAGTAVAAESRSESAAAAIPVPNPGTDLWREIRAREQQPQSRSTVRGVDSAELIRSGGEEWRQFRMGMLIPYSGLAFVGVLGVLVVFRLVRGAIKIRGEKTGRMIRRFSMTERVAHWVMAILFVLLGLTGIILLLGRDYLLPLLGQEVFSEVAFVSKRIHDFSGPVFALALIGLVVTFIRHNLPRGADFLWFLKAGGLFGHASAGFFNAGQKMWFWLATLGSAVLVVSGLVLDFPIFGQTRETMEFYHIIHSVAAAVLVAISFGHIYLGTVGMEGAFDSMVSGDVDETWAKEHHDLWYEDVMASGGGGTGTSPPADASPGAEPIRET